MFDSTPLKSARPRGRNETMHELAMARGSRGQRFSNVAQAAIERDRNADRMFDILAVWDDAPEALRAEIDVVSSWGPYELYECIPLFQGVDGRNRILCRFYYHGALSDRLTQNTQAQFRYALLNCLQQVTDWENVSPPHDNTKERA